MQWLPGHKLKNRPYRIEQELGQGGFGITYKARDLSLDVSVVIKTPNRKLQRDHNYPKYVENFIREAKQLAKLGLNPHPNIVRVSSLFKEDNLPCIVMDLIPGQSLYDLVLTQGKLSATLALKYIKQIGSALVVCHNAGIIHRDVHPNNILIHANSGKAILIDFGISGTTQTSRNTHSGNRCFAPWEQIAYWEGENSKTPQVDIYTLAASLYFLVTGEEPTECLARKYNQTELIAPKQLNLELSDKVNQAILKGLEIEPGDRPSSMQEWLGLLLAIPQTLVTPSEVISKVPIVKTAKQSNHNKYQTIDKANNSDRLADVEVTQSRGKTNINSEEKGALSSANNKASSTIKNTSKISASQQKTKALILGSLIFLTAILGIYAAKDSIFNITEIPETEESTNQIPTENEEDISEESIIPEAEESTNQIPTENEEDISEESIIPEAEESTNQIPTENEEDISEESIIPEAEESTNQIPTENEEDISEESIIPEAEESTNQIPTENEEDISESSQLELIATLTGNSDYINSVAFSPNGQTLASGSGDGTIKLWDVVTQQEIATLASGSNNELWAGRPTEETIRIDSVAFSPDGQTLASGSMDRTIKLWDIATQQEIVTLTGHSGWVNSVAFSPDGQILASGSMDGTIKLWDVATQQEIASLNGQLIQINSVAFSPDGQTLASSIGDKTIKLWDVATQQEIASLNGHSGGIRSIAFSPDGETLAIASVDNIKLWDITTQQEIASLNGYSAVIKSIAFNPDGKTLAIASVDNIKLWDITTQQEIASLNGYSDDIELIAFSPDGETLASSERDKTIKLWKIPSNLK